MATNMIKLTMSLLLVGFASSDNTGPNFVIFFADDFGWGDLHSYGHPTQEKGRIDEMADNGIRFTQWYSAESLCTPSRMGMMTGRMPTRMGMGHTVFAPGGNTALPANETTIAERLVPLGYKTGMAGKWHLGINKENYNDGSYLPYHRGFESVGRILPFSNFWGCDESGRHMPKPQNASCFLYHNTTMVQQPIDHRNLTATLVSDAVSFINTHASQQQKFMYYLPFPQCHVSMFTGTNWSNTSVNGIFGDQIREMDWAVGQVLDALKDNGVDKNTLVFFTSDHGPHVELCEEGGTAAGLRGGKGDSSWEGGVRVPGIIYWPGVITPQVSDSIVSTMDVFATVLDFAGGIPANDRIMDGKSLAGMIRGTNASSPHEALFHYCGDNLMAVRVGDYKLRYYTEQLPLDNYSTVHCTGGWAHAEFFQGGWDCKGGSVTTNVVPELFHITSDPSERYPLLVKSDWLSHVLWAKITNTLPSLDYYDEIGLEHDLPMRSANSTCGGPNSTIVNHTSFAGYAGSSLQSNTLPAMEAECTARCCADDTCSASVVQTYSLNKGIPEGSCKEGQPCCWLVDAENAVLPGNQCANCTLIFTRASPYPPIPTGPYADLLKKIDAIVAKHEASMVRGSIPGGEKGDFLPCCNKQEDGANCGCNYPSEHIP